MILSLQGFWNFGTNRNPKTAIENITKLMLNAQGVIERGDVKNMPDITEIYGSAAFGNYMKVEDLKTKTKYKIVAATIQKLHTNDGKEIPKLVIALDNGKLFTLNRTNAERIARNLKTPDYTKWIGGEIELKQAEATFQGKDFDVLRVVKEYE